VNLPLIIGHRGAPERAVENTEKSFRAALEAGVDIVETDVRLTSDGFIAISHDSDFSRFGGPDRPISRCTRSELERIVLKDEEGRTGMPLFMDEALRLFPETLFSVDLKDSGSRIVRVWSDLLHKSVAERRCRTASFNDRTLKYFKRENPGISVSLARYGVVRLLLSTLLGFPRSPGAGEGVLQLPEHAGILRILTPGRIARWQKAGWKVQVWTVDDEKDMRRFAEWGIDGIITNKPFLLKKVLASTKLQES